jgi:5-methyltetrahydropteroyltriglutamate--homocysteine methyltransferase
MVNVKSANLGFPRMGANRELKKMVENFWAGKIDEKSLFSGAKKLRSEHWKLQKEAGLDFVPSNDFSFYDQMLDHVALFGCVPEKYQTEKLGSDIARYFAMSRGVQRKEEGVDIVALEMKKWFDTNYHYLVPEFEENQRFVLSGTPKPVQEFKEAFAEGIVTRPVLLGPLTFLKLGKAAKGASPSFNPLTLVDSLVPLYENLLSQLSAAGAEWVQIDEPILVMDLDADIKQNFAKVYDRLSKLNVKIMLTTYFGSVDDNLSLALDLPVAGVHFDLVRAPEQIDAVLAGWNNSAKWLSLGLVNGRNIWRTDLNKALTVARKAAEQVDNLIIAPSCSLLHSPFSTAAEKKMDPKILEWLCFAVEKLHEVVLLTKAVAGNDDSVAAELEKNEQIIERRRKSPLTTNETVQNEVAAVSDAMFSRQAPFSQRYPLQKERLNLPRFPTTTIGSFPQTKDVRVARQKFKKNEWTKDQYDEFINKEISSCCKLQGDIGLDVLVHGESERNDMVEYFGEQLRGYVFSENGWVQSYGSRCVKPPIIYGDIYRPKPMTVEVSVYAQSLSTKPVKGMLTGPVTCLQWSFVRDDKPRKDIAFQLALALRKEVQDLEKAGIMLIQIDEPAIREGLPLRRREWNSYLKWAVDAFLLCSTGVKNDTQIHSHFCYSDFNDIFESIMRLDADVITIENARSDLKLLEAFKKHGYPNAIGPGIYDIHSPRVPSVEEMFERIKEISNYVDPELLWINPDCGLKSRKAAETVESLRNMLSVAELMRKQN